MTAAPRRAALPQIDPTRCTGCGWCVAVCAPHVLSLHADGGRKASALDDAAGCTGCALCALRCPFGAIRMRRRPAQAPEAGPASDAGRISN
ncbi:MAG TPA: 4Fe-4S dicluster domain-containing protein [Ottowia sp.]|uniref:ATP-binding protein n=1 Tax=Ottowia sp. TaxID=1898956 RepID=UPI002BD988AD|nr:4Fe-4S binding protein [Ottowia sp.]MCZ2090236.1 4Fe-4S dicluster domain-containing protein [Burkholderiales bacterium]HNN35194.1 4Fe-4S dicluster domain-containing protein [Ottowia sp.]HNO42161.1 4Fe-4S dicluster domain-containing protein [Ottowia sp.]HNR84627.1 4Fe-4S dicluster domain-containing protein [Ottowia sp.]HNT84962.1 4Fe-4S dicluster domain-containing protein [Ottowia sp.]